MKDDYWKNFWNNSKIIKDIHPQKQVARTINKVPIGSKEWQKTLDYILTVIEIKPNDELLDLCAGNGLITIPFAKKCRHVLAVDISKGLLSNIDNSKNPNILIQVHDIRTLKLNEDFFSKIIMYAGIQYFTEKETVLLFEKVHRWLTDNGLFFVGDIPDVDKLWNFYNTSERKKAYFESVKFEKPIIGTWFKKEFMVRAAEYAGFSKSRVLVQQKYQINSRYRFDVLLRK